MVSTQEIADKILGQFDSIQKRPAMYFGSDDNVEASESFFHGYNAAAFALIAPDQFSIAEFYRPAVEARGWELRAISVATEMREKGHSEEQIVAELIAVNFDAWRAFLKVL